MQPKFVTKPAFTVVGLNIHVAAKSPKIAALWQAFGPRMREVQHLAEPGVCLGLMDHFDMAKGDLDYMACEPVLQAADVPAGMTSLTVPANTYAMFESTISTLPKTFDTIFGTWLPTSGYKQVAAPYFEHYAADFEPDEADAKVSIYIPVEKTA